MMDGWQNRRRDSSKHSSDQCGEDQSQDFPAAKIIKIMEPIGKKIALLESSPIWGHVNIEEKLSGLVSNRRPWQKRF